MFRAERWQRLQTMESAVRSGECNNPAPGPKGFIMVTLSKQPLKGISVVLDENWYGLVYFN